jgi:hypothetical protein
MRIFLAILFAVAASVPAAAQTTIPVADAAALRSAIAAAKPGDTIVFSARTFGFTGGAARAAIARSST